MIAKVAGGEAVIFNQDVFRLASVGPDGRDIQGTGEYTWLGHKAMQTCRPVLGPSPLEEGAQDLRIPITEHFGIGFNNVLAVKQKKLLFGYEAGAFTGARKEGQQGLFEQANSGILFLDEINEMELELQLRLLRVLQEQEVVRLGGKRRTPVEVRVITSTNRDLWQMIALGKFRQDLFYRLNVVDLRIPPLRERFEDIPLLARYFIEQFRTHFGTFVHDISPEAIRCLQNYSRLGNVRELQNCIERTMNLTTNEIINSQGKTFLLM